MAMALVPGMAAAAWLAIEGRAVDVADWGAAGVFAPMSPDLSWVTVLGSAGNLRAAVSDGTSVRWVREGDVLAGGWRVTRIAARPAGVTLSHDEAGHHALPFHSGRAEVLLDAVQEEPAIDTGGSEGGRGALTGSTRIIDGDTLDVRGTRVRLHGIDAPESAQHCRAAERLWPCGQDATPALAGHIGAGTVACEERDRDRYGRVVAVCRVGGGDINAWMVAQGWALAYRRYSTDYAAEERAARAAKRGVWQGDIVAPWDWRRGARLVGE